MQLYELSEMSEVQTPAITSTETLRSSRDAHDSVPSVMHTDQRSEVLFKSINQLLGSENIQTRSWFWNKTAYLSIGTERPRGMVVNREGVAKWVTTESLTGCHLWNDFPTLLTSLECVPNIGSECDPILLCLELLTSDNNAAEMFQARDLLKADDSEPSQRLEIMRAILSRLTVYQVMLVGLNLKRHARRGLQTETLLMLIFEMLATASIANTANIMKCSEIKIAGLAPRRYLCFRNNLWKKDEAFQFDLKDLSLLVWNVTKYQLCLDENVEVLFLTSRDNNGEMPSIPNGTFTNGYEILTHKFGVEMAEVTDQENWLAKSAKKVLVLDYALDNEESSMELVLFPMANGFILTGARMPNGRFVPKDHVIQYTPSSVQIVDNLMANLGFMTNLRSCIENTRLLESRLTYHPVQSDISYFTSG